VPADAPTRSPLCESHAEELANAIIHGLGAIASVVALVFMVIVADDAWKVVGASIYGTTLILLFLSSTLYHSFRGPRMKALFQVLDHAAIYLLIAGSYTPLTLVTLRGPWGWSLFGIVWFLAICGILTKALMPGDREHWLSTALYLVMGWLAVIAIGPIIRGLPPQGFWLIVAGGLCYSFGVIFFVWHKLKFSHAIWHLFVLAGSACHVVAVTLYILR
jgi:hemolysin III